MSDRDVLVVDRSAGTGWRPEKPEHRGAPGAAAPTGKDPLQQVRSSKHQFMSRTFTREWSGKCPEVHV